LGIAFDDLQQYPGRPFRHAALLLPILNGSQRQMEALGKSLL